MVKTLSWTVVLLWMALIFSLSHQPATESSQLSTGVTEVILQTVEKVAPNLGFDSGDFNHIVRKNAHFFIYLLLGVFVVNALRRSGIQHYKSSGLALLICVLYALSDEMHQLYVPGRGAQIKDVLIDSAGAFVGVGLYLLVGKIIKRTK